MSGVVVTEHLIDVGDRVPGLTGHRVAADVFMPPDGSARPLAFCCLPGGGMSRAYWNLRVDGDESYSFARWAAARGFPVIIADHLGTGGSALPEGAPAPPLGQVVAADDAAFRALCDEIRTSGIGAGPIPGLRTVGVGHSMGAVLTVRQQAVHKSHDAVALLGFGTAGLPAHLPPEVLAEAADGPLDDRRLAALALRVFGTPYVRLRGEGTTAADVHDEHTATPVRRAPDVATMPQQRAMGAATAPRQHAPDATATPTQRAPDAARDATATPPQRTPDAVATPVRRAMEAAGTALLGAGGLLSMLPGNVAADLARLTVPVLVLNGERDPLISGDPAGRIGTVLAGSGHNHNIAPSRARFWDEVLRWAQAAIPT